MTTAIYVARSSLWVPILGGDSTDPGAPPSDGTITHGSQIDETNTGYRGGLRVSALSDTQHVTDAWIAANNGGSYTISGWTFQNCGFNFGEDAPTQTVTFQDCKFIGIGEANGSAWFNTDIVGSAIPAGFNLVVDHCEFDGNDAVTAQAEVVFIGGHQTYTRCHVHNLCGLTRNGDNNWEVTECFVHSLADVPSGEPHTSCVGHMHGSNVIVQRNKLFTCWPDGTEKPNAGPTGALVSLARQDQGQDITNSDNVKFLDNAIQGGGYSMHAGGEGDFTLTNFTASGNVFYRDTFPKSGQFGPVIFFDNSGSESSNVWSNNTWGPIGPHNLGGDSAEGVLVPAN